MLVLSGEKVKARTAFCLVSFFNVNSTGIAEIKTHETYSAARNRVHTQVTNISKIKQLVKEIDVIEIDKYCGINTYNYTW